MVASAVTNGISDVQLRWNHLLNNGALSPKKIAKSLQFPELSALVSSMVTPMDSDLDVLTRMPDEETLLEMREWLEENCSRNYKLYGRIHWLDRGFSIDRQPKGLLVRFRDPGIAMCFKLVFYQRPEA